MDVITSMATIPNAKASDWGVGGQGLSACSLRPRSSGAIHRYVPPEEDEEVSVQFRLAIIVNPKSLIRAHPDLSTRIFAWNVDGEDRRIVNQEVRTYPFQITVHNLVGV
jgi:hypothetical protein